MKIDQYNTLKTTKKSLNTSLDEIFLRISLNNNTTPKKERKGNVFATRTNHGRQYKDIKEFTGLMFIDLDNCKDHEAVKKLFKRLNHTKAVWFSSSGVNVHALIAIPVCQDIDEYKRRFKAFKEVIEPYLDGIAEIDTITSCPTQLAFESYDPDIWVYNVPDLYMEITPKEIIRAVTVDPNITPTNAQEKWVVDWIYSNVPKFQHPGYTQLIKFAKTLGGHCSGGYIEKGNALYHLEAAIKGNTYFNSSKSSGSINTYVDGAISSFNAGLSFPLEWSINKRTA